jgi:hypothetical protein
VNLLSLHSSSSVFQFLFTQCHKLRYLLYIELLNLFGFAECISKNIKTHPHLGGGANLLDCPSISRSWFRIGALFSQRILHGVLVFICCLDQACRENTSEDDSE